MAKTYYSPFFPLPEDSGAKGSTIPIVTPGTVQDIIDDIDKINDDLEIVGPGDDYQPPVQVVGLALSSTLDLDNTGNQIVTLKAQWTPSSASDLAGYVLAIREGSGGYVEFTSGPTSNFYTWSVRGGQTFTVKVKAFDRWGNYGAFSSEVSLTSAADFAPPAAPTGLYGEASLGSIFLRWNNPADRDLAQIRIYESNTNSNFVYYASVNAAPSSNGAYTRTGLGAGVTRWFRITAVDTSGNESAPSPAQSFTTPSISETDFTPTASGVTPVIIVTALPTSGNYEGRVAMYQGKLWRYTSGAWTKATDTADLSGPIVATDLVSGIITTTDFASNIQPLRKITNLSETGSVNDVAIYTVDNKLYRYNGSAWVKNVDAVDIAGLIQDTQINAVSTTKLVGTVNTNQIANDAITLDKFADGLTPIERVSSLPASGNYTGRIVYNTTNGKLYRYNGTGWVSNTDATDITGTITSGQIESLVSSKISGQITNAQIQSITAAKLTDQIQGTQISDSAISTPKLAAGAITSAKIAAGAITTSKLAVVPESIIPDPYFADEEWWTAYGYDANGWVFEGPVGGNNAATLGVSKCITLTPNQATRKHAWGTPTPYNGSGQVVRFRAIGVNQSPDSVYVGIRFKDWQLAQVGGVDLEFLPSISGIQTKTSQITVPANTAYYQTVIYNRGANNGGANTGSFYPSISAIKLDVAATGELIVDGAITASKIAANAITANKLTIASRPVSTIGFNMRVDNDNVLRWDAGSIQYMDSNGYYAVENVTSGSATYGSNYIYFVYTPGRGVLDYSTDAGLIVGQNSFHLATWQGGKNLTIVSGMGTLISGGRIVTSSITAAQIAADTITATQIAAGAITTSELNTGAVTADKIAVGTITADRIASNTITARNLVVADYTNMVDFGFNEGVRDKWTFQNEVNYYPEESGYTYVSTGRDCAFSVFVPVIPGEAYNVSARVFNTDPNYNANIYVMYADDAAGMNATSWLHSGAATSTKNTWVDFSANVTPTKSYARILLQTDKPSANSTYVYWKRPSMRRAANATLIVDGSITTNKMLANSIKGDRIKVNTLNADRIVSNSITTNKLVVATRPFSVVGIDMRVDTDGVLKWNSGFVQYVQPSGSYGSSAVSGASVSWAGSAWYIYYVPGRTYLDYSNQEGAVLGDNTVLHVATWFGGSNLVVKAGVGTLLNGDRIVTNSINATKIVASSITSDKIAANTITAANIAGGTITADKIASATITGDKIAANSITTSKLVVAPVSLCPDPYFTDIDFWSSPWDDSGTTGWYAEEWAATAAPAAVGTRCVTLWDGRNGGPGSARKHIWSRLVACPSQDSKIRLRFVVENVSNQWVAVSVRFLDQFGNEIVNSGITGQALATGVQTITVQGTVPYGATKMQFIVYNQGGYTFTSYARITGVVVDVAASSDLIVDGAVTADKIAANSVNASKIVSNSITANKLTLATRSVSTTALDMRVDSDGLLKWNTCTIHYPDGSGNYASETINGGSASWGGNYLYFIYTPGRGMLDFGPDANIITYQNSFHIATWLGGTNLTMRSGMATIINGDRIVTNSINANKIQANTITAAQIAADTITAAQIAAGAISASEVAAGAITASKLAIRGENLFPDPQCQDINWWKGPGQGTLLNNGYVNPANDQNNSSAGWQMYTDTSAISYRTGGSRGMWQLWSDGGFTSTYEAQVVCPSIMCKSNTTYEFKVGCWNASNKACQFIAQYYDQAGAYITGYAMITFSAGDIGTRLYAAKFKTPDNAVSVRLYFQVNGNAAFSGYVNVGNFSLREAAAGTMIVDGTITASHIIASGMTGDVITAGTLNANRLVSNSSLPATLSIGNTGFNLQTLSDTTSQTGLNSYNADFLNWPDKVGSALPLGWSHWSSTSNKSYNLDQGKNALRIVAPAGADNGIYQNGDGHGGVAYWDLYNDRWVIIEATVRLMGGTFQGAGILLRASQGGDTYLSFANDATIDGWAPGNGTVGLVYTYRKLVKMNAGSNVTQQMFLMNHYGGIGSTATANDINWIHAGWRYATEAEVNPAKQINAFTTLIEPGKISIVGGTTLNSWKNGNDSTEIRGGAIAANTITANKLTIGNRGINFTDLNFQCSGNTVNWGAGAVYFTNDSNALQGIGLSAGSATFSGSSVWIWWNKGGTQLLSSTTWNNNPNDVLVAVYHGGNNINANYGRTIVNGDYIQTNTIQANRLNVAQLSAITGTIGTLRTASSGARTEISDNVIKVFDQNNVLRVKLGNLDL